MKSLLVRTVRQASTGSAETVQWFADSAVRPFGPGASLSGHALGNVVIEDRVLAAPTLARELAGDLATLSPGIGLGALELANADGALDAALDDIWRSVAVWLWDMDRPLAEAVFVFSADCGRVDEAFGEGRPRRLVVPLSDAMSRLDRPLQGSLFAGANNGTTILHEGRAGGIKGQPKPILVGDLATSQGGCGHLPGVPVSDDALTFLIHERYAGDPDNAGLLEVFDRGAPSGLAFDGNYQTPGALEARVLPAASFCTDRKRGLVKITQGLVGPVAFGGAVALGFLGPDGGPWQWCLAKVLAQAGTSGGAKANVAAWAPPPPNVDAAFIGPRVGWWFDAAISVREAAAVLCRSAGAVLAPSRSGVLAPVVLAPPVAIPAITLAAHDIVALGTDAKAPSPVGEVSVGWGRLWTTYQGDELAPALRGTPDEARLAAQWRWSVAEDASTKAKAADWRTVRLETALREEADAQALGAQLLALFGLGAGGARRVWRVTLEMTAARLAVDLGATVRLAAPGLGVDGDFILLGEALCQPRRDLMVWSLFG